MVPEQKDAVIDDFALADGKVFVNYLRNVASSVKVFDADGKRLGADRVLRRSARWAASAGAGTATKCSSPSPRSRSPSRSIATTSPSGKRTEWWRSAAPVKSGDFEVEAGVVSRRRTARKVPMFVRPPRRASKLDGNEPDAAHRLRRLQRRPRRRASRRSRVLWVEKGGVYALRQPARRRRVRRGVAQGRDAREEAERVRRLHRRGRVADREQGTPTPSTSPSTAAPTAACWWARA